MPFADDSTSDRLSAREKLALALFGVAVVAFGALVVWRAAYQQERKTDFGVYARAGFAVRKGLDLYATTTCDDRGWHYCYPSTFAIAMAPLGDPFFWENRDGYLPFGVSVGIWYLLSVGCTAFTVHALAKAALPDLARGSRRWWYARMVPVYLCIGGIGYTLSRGQINLLVLMFLAGMFAASIRKQPIRAGLWFAAAVALKVIPLAFALFAVVRFLRPGGRREWRVGLGFVLGLVVLLGVVPTLVFGFDGMVRSHVEFVDTVLAPGAFGTGDQTRARELTDATATDSQSFLVVTHNLRYPDPAQRPPTVDTTTRAIALSLSGLLVLVTFLVGVLRLSPAPPDQLIYLGSLGAIMLLLSPVAHVHYYVYLLPLVAGLWLKGLAARPAGVRADRRTMFVLIAWSIATTVPLLPDPASLAARDFGLGTAATTALWAFGMVRIARRFPAPI